MDTPKRHHLTIHQKLRIIEESKKPGFNRKDAMEKYRISKASLSRVLKSQTNKLQESKNTKGFNLRSGKNHELEMELYEWLVSMNKKGLAISGHLIKKQAQKLSERHEKDFYCENFNFSDGWLQNNTFSSPFKKNIHHIASFFLLHYATI